MDKKAFTLAEVLITLSILGVVAVITIPFVIGHYKKTITETKLKMMYSQLSKAVDIMSVENGPISKIVDESFSENVTIKSAVGYFSENLIKYINVSKSCNVNSSTAWRCQDNYGITNEFKGDSLQTNAMSQYKLKNGMNLFVATGTTGPDDLLTRSFYLIVDINGNANPNKVGHDVFYFAVHGNATDMNNKNSLDCGRLVDYAPKYYKSHGGYMDEFNCYTSGAKGYACTCQIMRNGWKIPKDYPVKF